MSSVIKVENLSKQYRLGQIGTGTISHDINRWWHRIRGNEDPYLKIGETNDRTQKGKSEYVWALEDINFEVKQGEVLGIIGRNGAGKSTLLKLLSRTTAPTTGSIKINGRVASLLEVGTGFHPELSGRENIFLNGAILGMTKKEIKNKFDEIVDFAGVERYIDTPVKRYSSGMYVRLAFGVAAHLESEILIVDEVLAVGDAEFQRKCLGKMSEVSKGEGKTVLFVSHNMGAIQKLCDMAILLRNGRLVEDGQCRQVVSNYLKNINSEKSSYEFKAEPHLSAFMTAIEIVDNNGSIITEVPIGASWSIKIFFKVNEEIKDLVVGIGISDINETPIRTSWAPGDRYLPGDYVAVFKENILQFCTGKYKLVFGLSRGKKTIQFIDENIWLNISDIVESLDSNILQTTHGILINQMKINVTKINE